MVTVSCTAPLRHMPQGVGKSWIFQEDEAIGPHVGLARQASCRPLGINPQQQQQQQQQQQRHRQRQQQQQKQQQQQRQQKQQQQQQQQQQFSMQLCFFSGNATGHGSGHWKYDELWDALLTILTCKDGEP